MYQMPLSCCFQKGKRYIALWLLVLGLSAYAGKKPQITPSKLPLDAESAAILAHVLNIETTHKMLKEKGISAYKFGMNLRKAGHIDEAKHWFTEYAAQTSDLQYLYGLAWVKYKSGDFNGALQDAQFILNKKPKQLIRARTEYLLGLLNVDQNHFKKATHALKAARSSYAAIGKNGGQYMALSMQAWVEVRIGNHQKAEILLNQAEEYNNAMRDAGEKPYSRAWHQEIRAEIAFKQGQFFSAYELIENAGESYRLDGNKPYADFTRAKGALFLLLAGYPKDASKVALDIQTQTQGDGNQARLAAINAVTLAKIAQCSQNRSKRDATVDSIKRWADHSAAGPALLDLLEYVMDEDIAPCPEWR